MAIYLLNNKILTVGVNGIATSSNCCCDNEQWRKCADDTNAAVLTAGHTAVDYAWLCLSSVWVKCYNYTTTATASTNPTVLEQCDNAAPIACTDLVGWPASDDFGGTGCNSGSWGDTNASIRWNNPLGQTPTISLGSLNMPIVVSSGNNSGAYIQGLSFSGDFTAQINGPSISPLPSATYAWLLMKITVGGNGYYVGWEYVTSRSPNPGHVFEFPGSYSKVSSPSLASSYKFIRSGNNLSAYYGATQIGSTKTVSGNLTEVLIYTVNNAANCTGSITSFDLDAVTIDPSGTACT